MFFNYLSYYSILDKEFWDNASDSHVAASLERPHCLYMHLVLKRRGMDASTEEGVPVS